MSGVGGILSESEHFTEGQVFWDLPELLARRLTLEVPLPSQVLLGNLGDEAVDAHTGNLLE